MSWTRFCMRATMSASRHCMPNLARSGLNEMHVQLSDALQSFTCTPRARVKTRHTMERQRQRQSTRGEGAAAWETCLGVALGLHVVREGLLEFLAGARAVRGLDGELRAEDVGELRAVAVAAARRLLLLVVVVAAREEVAEDQLGNLQREAFGASATMSILQVWKRGRQ
eukprot:942709-Rhodomonas_salina.4